MTVHDRGGAEGMVPGEIPGRVRKYPMKHSGSTTHTTLGKDGLCHPRNVGMIAMGACPYPTGPPVRPR